MSLPAELSWHELLSFFLSAAPTGVSQSIAAASGAARHTQRLDNDAFFEILFTIPPLFQSGSVKACRQFLASPRAKH
jgi:hypothetical protein